jgi:hypothetical protein
MRIRIQAPFFLKYGFGSGCETETLMMSITPQMRNIMLKLHSQSLKQLTKNCAAMQIQNSWRQPHHGSYLGTGHKAASCAVIGTSAGTTTI